MVQDLSVIALNDELKKQLADPAIVRALLATTFKEFDEKLMRQSILEAMLRGHSIKAFLQKDLYAIKYKDSYSIITSIDYARKIGMRSGVIGKSAPQFEVDGKKLVSCSITIKRRVGKDVGEFTATVYFDEFSTGRNLWSSKPRLMLAKVCEMAALRMCCPEEMSQVYTEEEFDKDKGDDYDHSPVEDDAVPTISIGDDHGEPAPNLVVDRASTKEAPEIPESATERKLLILKELKRIDPSFDTADMKQARQMVSDLTELEFAVVNYPNIIHLLARK